MAVLSSILAWRIPQTEEPGGLQSMGLQRVGHDCAHTHTHTHPMGLQESDMTVLTHTHTHTHRRLNKEKYDFQNP